MAYIEEWVKEKGYPLSRTRLYMGEGFPPPEEFDLLVVMGGPMNVYEEGKYPWLKKEKAFLAEAIRKKKFVLGICLGAQLLADVLGGKVSRNREAEIGWFPVKLTKEGEASPFFKGMPKEMMVFHWHGDRFGIPPGAERVAESEACDNQAFVHCGRAIGLQFHFEISAGYIGAWLREAGELPGGKYVQSPEEMAGLTERYVKESNARMRDLLEKIDRAVKPVKEEK
jgi:GMP synthase (glutamine-hydrolysing)